MPDIELMGATYPDVPAVDLPKSGGGMSRFYDPSEIKYAASATSGGSALNTEGIPFGAVDSTSTSTVFTASVSGITELKDGTVVLLKNGVVTSAANFTININNLGAKPVYSNMATGNSITPTNPTRESSIFNINYTLLFVYSEDLVSGGCWINYRGYNSDTNTIGYQLRTNSTVMKTADQSRYYRMFFTSADGTHWVPANTAKDNSATSTKTVNQRPINPFGRIIYFSYTTNLSAESDVPAAYCWSQYAFSLGYSFNTTGAALTLTAKSPVYLKCAPQADGSAIIDSTTPYVQSLPSTADGKIYIFLGIAYSATNIELVPNHPVYEYKDGAIRLWTNAAASGSIIDPATAMPIMDGTAAVGTSAKYAREDHVHPSDTSKANTSSVPNAASIDNSGLISFKNGSTSLFTLQLPIYTPTVLTEITFTVTGTTYTAEDGMTWAEWVASEYNTNGFTVDGSYISGGGFWVIYQTNNVQASDAIVSGVAYEGVAKGGSND